MSLKLSKYLEIVNYKDGYIFFNSLSGSIFFTSHKKHLEFTNYKNNLDKLDEVSNGLFKILKETRNIIEDDYNELDIIRFRNKRDVFIDNSYKLTILPTMDCNFKCWYCYEKHHKSCMDSATQQNVLDFVKKLVLDKKINSLSLSWFGGEPLMYFNDIVYNLSKEIKKICNENSISFTNSITTNGFLINDYMIDKFREIDLFNFQITLDGNETRHNKSRITKDNQATYRKIINNITSICKINTNSFVILRINYNNQALDEISEIVNDFDLDIRKKISISFHRIWQTFLDETSIDNKLKNEISYLKSQGFFVSNNHHFNLYQGKKCYADCWHQAIINYDGNVFKCTARDFTETNREGVLKDKGEIIWDTKKIIRRFSKANFENTKCLECKILPICIGPCSQKCIECTDIERICDLNVKEITISDYIIDRYENILAKNSDT